jgi:hypothetical protein
VLSNKTGDVRTERDNAEMIDAGEIERNACEVGSQTLAFEWWRHFGVGIKDAVGKALIRDNGEKAANAGFEAVSFFVVSNGYVVEIHVHESLCGFDGFFIPEIAERAGRTLLDLFDDAIAAGAVDLDPRARVDVEDFAEALDALRGVNADAGFPNHGDFAVRIGLFRFAHEDLRVTGKV